MPEPHSPALLREMWSQLRLATTHNPKGAVPVLPLDMPTGPAVWTSVLSTGQAALLVEAAGTPETLHPSRSANIRLTQRSMTYRGSELGILQLECHDDSLEPVFAEVCAMVLDRTSEDVSVHHALTTVMQDLGELLGLGAPTASSPRTSSSIGLMGELLVLRELVELDPKLLHSWTGPSGSRFDFRAGGFALEVKTLLKKQTETVTVSSLSQLEPPEGGELWLYALILEPDPLGDINITRLYRDIRQKLPIDTALIVDEKLRDELEAAERSKPEASYTLHSDRLYKTDKQFPALTTARLTDAELPVGVSHVTYRLDLAAAAPWRSEHSFMELLKTGLDSDDAS